MEDTVLHEIGFWHEPGSGRLAADPRRLVRPHWAADERTRLMAYLRAGAQVGAYMGTSYCRFGCGGAAPRLGCRDLSDGVWLWPDGLVHYLEVHDVALPEEFLAHARANDFRIPAVDVTTLAVTEEDRLARSAVKWEAWVSDNGGVLPKGAT